jgi:protein-arginine kinase activator protein McsA
MKKCSACGDYENLVVSKKSGRVLCQECLDEIEKGIIPVVTYSRASVSHVKRDDEPSPWQENNVRLMEDGRPDEFNIP